MAEAHHVTVGTLIGKELAPVLEKEYLTNSSNNGGSRFYDNGFELNGFGTLAADFSQGLAELTGCSNLTNLTLINLSDLIPTRGVLRHSKAWCPKCLEDWRKSNADIYEPLLWAFKEANICKRHMVRLENKCPCCEREIPLISRKSRNGFCSFCGCWLGLSKSQINKELLKEQTLWETYVVENIEYLLKIKDNPSLNLSYEKIYNVLRTMIEQGGGTNCFSRNFCIPKSTVRDWYESKSRPSLKALLQVLYGVRISIKETLGDDQVPIPSVPDASYYVLSEIQNRTKTTKRSFDWQRVEVMLKDIISSRTNSVPSVNEVARNLKCDKRLLYRHFPSLCKEISAKHAIHVQKRKAKRIEEDCKMISEATLTLHNSGIYPSRRKIEDFLAPKIILREKAYQMAWKEALEALGL